MKHEGIKKRGKSYYFIIDQPRGPDGERRQVRKGGFRTKDDAANERAKLMVEFAKGSYVEPSKQSVKELMQDWLAAGAPGKKSRDGLKASTLAGYRDIAERYIWPAIGGVKARDLTSDQVSRLYRDLEERGRKVHPKKARKGAESPESPEPRGLSSRTVVYTATVLSACLGDAVRKGKLGRNVAEGQRLPYRVPVRDSSERIWTGSQRRQFLDGCKTNELFAAFHLAAHTGLRRGEICGLRWQDIDLAVGRLTVTMNRVLIRQRQDDDSYQVAVVDQTPKSHKPRTVHIDPGTVEMLRDHRVAQLAAHQRRHGPDSAAPTDVFLDPWTGERLSPDTLSYRFELAVKASGLPYLSLHGLRHTWATLALQAGVDIKIVSEMLGHKNVAVTWNIYQHVVPSMQAATAAKVAAL